MTTATAVRVRGVPLELHPSPDYVSDVIRETGDFYEAAILDKLAKRVPGGVLVDIGAMIGTYSAYLASFVRHTAIHAFEPLPANLALLRRNVAGYPTVIVHGVALSDRDARMAITFDSANYGHAVIVAPRAAYPRPDGSVYTPDLNGQTLVDVTTLDSYYLNDVTLIKVDVEGREAAVLRGAADTIARCRPLLVIEDWSGPPAIPGYRLAVSWEREHQTFLYEPTEAAIPAS